jgi:hypothetical protein
MKMALRKMIKRSIHKSVSLAWHSHKKSITFRLYKTFA